MLPVKDFLDVQAIKVLEERAGKPLGNFELWQMLDEDAKQIIGWEYMARQITNVVTAALSAPKPATGKKRG